MSSLNESPALTGTRAGWRNVTAWFRTGTWRRFGTWPVRDQLLGSHVGLALLLMLGFATTLYWTTSRAMYRQAEADQLAAAQLMLQELANRRPPAELSIPGAYFHRFGPAPRDQAYFAVWDAAGRRIAASESLPEEVMPAEKSPPTQGPHPFATRTYGTHLDLIVATPQGGQLLIGRPLAKEFDGLWRLVARLFLTGLVCLLIGCIAAWWLAMRLARPLVRMSSEAETITSRNLSQRLAAGRAPQEVSRLAVVFNALLERLEAAFSQQMRFTADAAHELRTPVSIVLSQAEHTLSRERSVDDYREALQTCLRAAQRMRKLVEDLLLLSRADAGKLLLSQEPFDLSAAVRSVVDFLQPLAASKDVRLETHLMTAPIVGNYDQIARVAMNLITNAMQYNVPQGEVVVETRTEGAMTLLIVRDHGQGIPLEDQPHLFDRFYRVDRARTQDDDTGTGLGLSLVAEIVAAHGGTIAVESRPNGGTTMTVRLPAAATGEV